MPKRIAPSRYMTPKEAKNVLKAATFAACRGQRFNRFVTINASRAGIQVKHGRFFASILKYFHDWQRLTVPGYEPLHVAVVEAKGGVHIHLLVRVNPSYLNGFRRRVAQWIVLSGGRMRPRVLRIKNVTGWQRSFTFRVYVMRGLADTLAYMVKGVEPRYHSHFRVKRKNRVWQGLVHTKRTFISVGLHPAARHSALVMERTPRGAAKFIYVPAPISRQLYFLRNLRLVPKWLLSLY